MCWWLISGPTLLTCCHGEWYCVNSKLGAPFLTYQGPDDDLYGGGSYLRQEADDLFQRISWTKFYEGTISWGFISNKGGWGSQRLETVGSGKGMEWNFQIPVKSQATERGPPGAVVRRTESLSKPQPGSSKNRNKHSSISRTARQNRGCAESNMSFR